MTERPRTVALWQFATVVTTMCLVIAGLVSFSAFNRANAAAHERQTETLQQQMDEHTKSIERLTSALEEHHFEVPDESN